MRILILGDSLPFPRPLKGQPVAVTWPSLLKSAFPEADIWLRATPRSCILDVVKELFFFTDSLPDFDVMIVQTGIVDCAPRPYPRWVYKLLETFFGMARLRAIERFAHDRLLWLYNLPWVSEQEFASHLRQIVHTAHARNPRLTTLFVPIAPPSRTIVRTLPGIDQSAAVYNRIMERETKTLGATVSCRRADAFADSDPLEITIEDGHHLSALGHGRIADSLINAIKDVLPPNTPPSDKTAQPAASVWPKILRSGEHIKVRA